jgi:hypothetical protein
LGITWLLSLLLYKSISGSKAKWNYIMEINNMFNNSLNDADKSVAERDSKIIAIIKCIFRE